MKQPRSGRPPRRESYQPSARGDDWRTPRNPDQTEPGESHPGLFRIYGRQPVLEVLRLNLVRSLEITRNAHGRAVEEILDLARQQHIPVERVESFIEEDGQTVQGVRALAEPPRVRHDLRRFVEELPESPPPLLLMLDGITDPHNFGAILRTADAAGVNAVIIRERRQSPLTDTVIKASAGAAYLRPIFQVVNLNQVLRMLAEAGFWFAAAVLDEKSISYRNYRWDLKTLLIVGAEGAGVSDLLKREADERILIPMSGKIDSLNVSVATGIILFEAAKARGIV